MSTADRLAHIHQRLAPLRQGLLEHEIYGQIDRLEKLQVFMQHHVFAVWDFMSLLKTLQLRLCSSGVPWLPPTDPTAARLVNEIMLGEETDEDGHGGFASHFDLYRRSMDCCGATGDAIDGFLVELRQGQTVEAALSRPAIPPAVRPFVRQTFAVIDSGDLCAVASAFTFGREDLLPDVFQRIVDRLGEENDGVLDDFKFYLHRHIELDGDHHGPLAARMIAALCGDDDAKWQAAEDAAVSSLQSRRDLWDGMVAAIQHPA
ncbi:DUF3050 domain-containing protein [Lignipirellula cremea]|uniref:DUF3050 domain-containing protein n=1 Tax=Lignipirellula cremea TaxID=2528010 RepID=A0A518DM02_9BACT|nr:DUF3050 domain-containing protein [Lignipirellula cremea]QDU92867.1 hypothetical protein Pla8534_06400 [Lignipirellula cremea]